MKRRAISLSQNYCERKRTFCTLLSACCVDLLVCTLVTLWNFITGCLPRLALRLRPVTMRRWSQQ